MKGAQFYAKKKVFVHITFWFHHFKLIHSMSILDIITHNLSDAVINVLFHVTQLKMWVAEDIRSLVSLRMECHSVKFHKWQKKSRPTNESVINNFKTTTMSDIPWTAHPRKVEMVHHWPILCTVRQNPKVIGPKLSRM